MKNRAGLNSFFSQNRKTLYIILGIVMISVLTLTVVYAALSTTLNINGTAEVSAASWDIHLDNVQLNSSSATTTPPAITNSTTATFSTTLSKPGDFYMFTIDVVNNGSIDAMIDSVTKTPELSDKQKKYLNYIVEYQNGESITIKQLVEKNSFVRLKVKVEFRKDITASDLPTQTETLNLSFKVGYVQADESNILGIPNAGKLIKVVSGDYNTVGSEICIGEECFYVISSTENDVTMLSKYNLYVGRKCVNGIWYDYDEEASGKQNSKMLGFVSYGAERHGIVAFSNDDIKGNKYSSYEGSIVEEYVNRYDVYLKSLGVSVKLSRLIFYNELILLGCSLQQFSCLDAPAFIYSTSYWSSSENSDVDVWRINSLGEFGAGSYSDINSFGVRPVIVISKSEF